MKRLQLAAVVLLVPMVVAAATLDDARSALADRRYDDAAKILAGLKTQADDHRLYLLATAQTLGGKHAAAVATLDQLLARHAKSTWHTKSLFKKADILVTMGKFAEAERLYETQIDHLASEQRRGEIERVYLTHADQAFEPTLVRPKPGEAELEKRPPDYKAALKLYERAREVDALPAEADRIDLRIGLCQAQLKQHDAAIKQFEAFLEKHAKSTLVPEALYHQGLALIARKDPDRARAAFEKLLRDHADSARAPEAQYKIAATYDLPKPSNESDLSFGARALREFLRKYPRHKLAPEAGLEIGQAFYNFRQYDKAIEEFAAFVKAFGDRKDAVEVGKAAYLIGHAHRQLNRFDQATAAWRDYLRQFPAHEHWQAAQGAIVSARYDQARHFFRKKKWAEAEKAFAAFAAAYPLDSRNASALMMLGQIPYEQEKWQDAIAAWRKAVAKFPRHNAGQRAQYLIAHTLDRKLHDFEKAIGEYKKIKDGPQAGAAAQRLRELREPHLLVTYERIFRTNETPKLKVDSRNIEKLHFKAYRLNAEDYFRRMGGLARIEELDIALIDPHQEWDAPVKDYKKYLDIESQLDLPFKEPGLFAIHVSAEKLEATVMILVTDLAILVKSSRKDVLVFAENLRTGKPQPGAELLISDGRKVVLAGKTGDDGIYRAESDDLKKVRSLRVYAVAGGSPASNALGLSRLGVALGLQPRGILYTDRPAYRPGGKVQYRGIVRLVTQGSFDAGKGQELTVRVTSAQGHLVHEAKHVLSEFGTVAGDFGLNARDPLGEYRIVATLGENKPTFTGQFRVDEYQLPLYRVVFDFPKSSYFRGERIKGTVRVEYFFGQAVAGKDVRYRLKDQRWQAAKTDDKGEVAVDFETDLFRETEVLPLLVMLPADGIAASKNILLATTEFQAEITTLRDTYLVGERFDAKVKATNFEGKPVARKVTASLYRFVGEDEAPVPEAAAEPMPGQAPVGYVKVDSKVVTTAKDTGEVTAALTAGKEGGRHMVRVEALDGRKNLVVAERRIFVSGDDDKIKLRILADSDEYRVGDKAPVTLVNRAGPALALLTWEGERIYRYQLVPLKKGANRIEVDIPESCAPNFTLGAAILHENEFHRAGKALAVLKGLRVALSPSKAELLPGERLTVKIKTTDQGGRPVPAELSLAVVDEALYARYSDRLPKLSEFFHQRRTGRFYNVAASNGFKYKGQTRATSDVVSRERERRGEEARPLRPARQPMNQLARQADGDANDDAFGENGGEQVEDLAQALDPSSGGAAGGGQQGAQAAPRQLFLVEGQDRNGPRQVQLGVQTLAICDEIVRGRGVVTRNYRWAANMGDVANAPASTTVAFNYTGQTTSGRARGALVRLRDYFPQTAYWNPSVKTDANGEGSISFSLPDSTTGWRLVARGLTTQHLVGEATERVATKKPFSVELTTPAALTAGDKASVRASIRNFTDRDVDAALELKATTGGQTDTTKKKHKVAAGKVAQQFIEVNVRPGPQAKFQLQAGARDHADGLSRTVPVRHWGIPVRAGASGRSQQTVTLQLNLPPGQKYVKRSLVVAISASLPRGLVDAALAASVGGSCTEQTVAGGLTALSGLEMLDRLGEAPAAERARLAATIEEAIRTLALTHKSGGWTWAFESRQSRLDPFVTAYALEFLRRAERKGFGVPKKLSEASRAQAKQLFTKASTLPEKAALLYGLSFWGDADYSYVNRLDRLHERLDNQSLALLVLTFLNVDRQARAAELAAVLVKRSSLKPLPASPGQKGRCWLVPSADVLWRAVPVEATALAIEAVQRTTPRAPELAQAIDWLFAQRVGTTWGAARSTAAAVRALATYVGATKAEPQKYTLHVVVNGGTVRTVNADGMKASVTVDVPAGAVLDSNRVDLKLNGRGQFAYVCTLEGITDGVPKPKDGELLEVRREYQAAPRLFDGVEVPRGYSVVEGSYKTVKNPVDELPEGKTCEVSLRLRARQRQRYLVVEDYLPAGTSLVEHTLSGSYDRYELGDGRVVFYFSNPGNAEWFHADYRLTGRLRGQYRVLPARAYSFYSPYELVVGAPHELAVLPKDATPKREYVMTPDELYHFGKKHYDKEQHAQAEPLLRKLFTAYRLKDAPFKDTVKMLLYIALAQKDAKAVVDYFEVLKERYPELVMPFDKIIAVGRAYRERGEHERAVMVFRAIAEGFYFQEGQVAGVLEEAGDFIAATDFLEKLLAEYPDLPVVQSGLYSLAQRIYAKLPELEKNERLRKRVTRKELLTAVRGLLARFLAFYPDNAIADEVSFTLANAHLEDESHDKAIALCEAFIPRYPKSPLLDSYQYIAGYSYFVTDRPKQALDLCRKVAEGKYPTRDGRLALSDDRWNAIHMIAQVHHASREHEKALAEYEKVKTRFRDAAEAIAFLMRRHLSLPEVTPIVPGKKAAVDLTFRNVAACDLKVYKVDLMTLYLLERNLSAITRINLAGIKPLVERTVPLGEGKDYEEKTHALALPELAKPGAYLIVCKVEEVECSGMLLISSLGLRVQEDAQRGSVRVNVRDDKGAYRRKVYIKVVGSEDKEFKSGHTDLRGVFEATTVHGLATVIARDGDHYAFHRGQTPLAMGNQRYSLQYRHGQVSIMHQREMVEQLKQLQERAQAAQPAAEMDAKGNLKARLRSFQKKADAVWDEATQTESKGIAVQKAF